MNIKKNSEKFTGRINLILKENKKKEFWEACEKEDKAPSVVIRELINDYIEKKKKFN